uniref:RxLR effector protein n=1 Tax=Peronospora matthiolae TaxID=2874970 RepID=A0AAV1TEB6_9STRA
MRRTIFLLAVATLVVGIWDDASATEALETSSRNAHGDGKNGKSLRGSGQPVATHKVSGDERLFLNSDGTVNAVKFPFFRTVQGLKFASIVKSNENVMETMRKATEYFT